MNRFERWFHEQNAADQEAGVSRRSKLLWRVGLPLAATALAGAAVFNIAEASPDTHPYDLKQVHRDYTVRPGDSVFRIAQEAEPKQDPRDVAERIIETLEARDHVDHEHAASLQVGETVPLPADALIGQLVIPTQPQQ